MNRLRVLASLMTYLAASASVFACTPPPPTTTESSTQIAPDVLIDQKIARAFEGADVVFLARVVHESTRKGEYGQVARSKLKPVYTYKGRSSDGPKFLEKQLLFTCDQRPFTPVGQHVLVFARGTTEVERFTPAEDVEPAHPGIRPYERALKYVQEQSGVRKP